MKLSTWIVFLFFGLAWISTPCFSQKLEWEGFHKDSTISSLDGIVQRFYYYKSTESGRQPLVVFLHQWSWDYASFKNSLAPQTREKNWNFMHPDFRGPNNHRKACGSDYVIRDIDEAIDWAIQNLDIDTSRIYVVGASGGGHAALCSFMKSRHRVKEYSVWVPITDLKQWYFEIQTKNPKYAEDIIHCTCGDCQGVDLDEAVNRSPLFWKTLVEKLGSCKLKIYAGIHDGYTGAVPVSHSINFFNKVVSESGGEINDLISDMEMNFMVTKQKGPGEKYGRIGDRDIIYYKTFKNVSLTIFEGGHEILVDEVLPDLSGEFRPK
jgi:hypothetical protein